MLSKVFIGAIFCVLLIAIGLLVAIMRNGVPILQPPGLIPRLTAYLGNNVVETSPSHSFAERRSMRVRTTAAEFAARSTKILQTLGWKQVDEAGNPYLWVVSSTLFGFVDDVQLVVEADKSDQLWLNVRSASRIGRGDLGANTRHLITLRRALVAADLIEP